MSRHIYILTRLFPYGKIEGFLMHELEYWSQEKGIEITLAPMLAKGQQRPLPGNIKTLKTGILETSLRKRAKLLLVLKAVFSFPFLKELKRLLVMRKLSAKNLKKLIFKFYIVQRYAKVLENHLAKDEQAVLYSYWFELPFFASAQLKRKRKGLRVISRLHVFTDYHQDWKRQYASKADVLFPISVYAARHLQEQYRLPSSKLRVRHLGIPLNHLPQKKPSETHKTIRILSISDTRPEKRIDKIIDGIALFATNTTATPIHWDHFGVVKKLNFPQLSSSEKKSGFIRQRYQLTQKLDARAKKAFVGKNLTYYLHNFIPNDELYDKIKSTYYDVFINTSEIEGIPVSIMEAMSLGIPAIAPAIDGIPELVNNTNGLLISANPSPEEISRALSKTTFYRDPKVRAQAQQQVQENFNIRINYPKFMAEIIRL